jgi:hypothetical protein
MVACSDLRISVRDDAIIVRVEDREYRGPVPATSTLNELAELSADLSPVEYGMKLFDAVFVDPLIQGYAAALQDTRLICRVRLDIQASRPQLKKVHW